MTGRSPSRTAVDFLPDALSVDGRRPPPLLRGTLYFLALLVVAFVGWAALSDVDVIVVARGKLVTTSATVVVQPLETSVILGINVKAGADVKKGAVLATLDQTFADADLGQVGGRIASLDAQIARLDAELLGRDYAPGASAGPDAAMQASLFATRKSQYVARIDSLDKQMAKTRASIATKASDQRSLAARLRVAREIEGMRAELFDKQIGSKINLLDARNARMQIERDIELSRNEVLELEQESARVAAEREAFFHDWRQKANEEAITARRDRDALARQMEKAQKRSALVELKAPVDAIVLEVAQRSIGSVLKEAEPLFTLVPIDNLEVEVQIDAPDIGNVPRDAEARIKLDAFPFQRHGTLTGRLLTVSADSFADKERTGRQQTYYRARMALATREIEFPPRDFRLVPGMTVVAEIKSGQRTILSYLVYPILRLAGESLREP